MNGDQATRLEALKAYSMIYGYPQSAAEWANLQRMADWLLLGTQPQCDAPSTSAPQPTRDPPTVMVRISHLLRPGLYDADILNVDLSLQWSDAEQGHALYLTHNGLFVECLLSAWEAEQGEEFALPITKRRFKDGIERLRGWLLKMQSPPPPPPRPAEVSAMDAVHDIVGRR